MKWLRTKAKELSLLALFALALQFGLSFGHTHDDIAIAAAMPSASVDYSQTSTPDTNHDQDINHDLCAICASMAMSNTVLAVAPMLQVPLTFAILRTTPRPAFAMLNLRRLDFQSRAPPLA